MTRAATSVFLVPVTTASVPGQGEAMPLGDDPAQRLVQLTLGITHVREQQSLDVQVFGSPDGVTWSAKPVCEFPQKFYVGVSTLLFDGMRLPDVHFLQARWKMNRWGRGDLKPEFSFYLFAERNQM